MNSEADHYPTNGHLVAEIEVLRKIIGRARETIDRQGKLAGELEKKIKTLEDNHEQLRRLAYAGDIHNLVLRLTK